MEEEEEEALSTPFWVQRTTDHRRSAGLLLVVLLLLVTAVIFLVFVLPKTLSLSAQIFRPNSVKKSWDSLNLVLVLAALAFGFITRNKSSNDDGYSPSPSPSPSSSSSYCNEFQDSAIKQNEAQMYHQASSRRQRSDLSTSKVWDGHGAYSDCNVRLENQSPLIRRNISSYQDLRGFSSIDYWYGEDIKRRYYDDDTYTGRISGQGKIHRRHRSLEQVDDPRTVSQRKTVVIDTLLSKYGADVKLPSSDCKSPPARRESQPPEKEREEQLEDQRVVADKRGKTSRKVKKEVVPEAIVEPPMDADPPLKEAAEGGSSGRKRGGATKDFLNSLYHKKTTKKQRQRSVDKLEMHHLTPLTQLPPSSPPKPPPPALKNLFSLKKHKRKKTITVSLKPSSAAREAKPTSLSSRKTKSAPHFPSSAAGAAHKLPKQKMMSLFENLDEISNSGGESPLNRIPPAPPPPPPGFLRSPTWKFVVRGDYIRVNSSASSRSESPEIDDVESDFGGDHTAAAAASPLFYQSPNVDTKAESFISSFRAKLKLEKMHSIKNREVGLSGLGPRGGPAHI